MNNATLLWGGVLVAVIIAIGGYAYPTAQQAVVSSFGGITNYNSLETAGLAVGSGCDNEFSSCTGTTMTRINTGTCYIKPYATTIAASTTAIVDCQGRAAVGTITGPTTALTGVSDGDFVVLTLSTSTARTGGVSIGSGLSVVGASASTTAGYIQLVVNNGTGDTFTWPVTGAASGTASYIATDI